MWLIPQFEGDTNTISVLGVYNVPGGAVAGAPGVASQVPINTFVLGRLGMSNTADAFGWMVLIMSGALIINMLAYQCINDTVR